MRTKRDGDKARGGSKTWHEEILGYTFEIYLGVSRLMATLQIGPPKSPRKKRLLRRSR